MNKGFSIKLSNEIKEVNSFIDHDYDDFYIQNTQFDFLFEGVLLNKKKLLNEFALKDFETLILELFKNKKEQIIKEFEGEFHGFIWDKSRNKIFVFTNATSTQRVFYGKFGVNLLIDTSLVRLNETLQKLGIKTEPDLESIYQLLCIGGMLENSTVINGVFKILDAHYLEIDLESMQYSEKEYFTAFNKPYFQKSKEKAYQEINAIFNDAVVMEYHKDTEFGRNHLSLLSGGLDSRVAMLYAIKNNQIPDNAFCFSQLGYFDHTLSKKIAEDFGIHYEFVPLDDGIFLKKIDQLTTISEGLVFFTGAIHVQHALDHLQYENFGVFHSGQLGDAILGGYLSQPAKIRPSNYKIISNNSYLNQIESRLDKAKKNYESEEAFLLRNRGFNMIILGAHVLQQKRYQTSPFMSKEFLKFAAALPEELKFNHRFYIEWVNEHCKEATKYRWERTLMKPNANWKTSFGDQFLKRGFKILNEKILKTPQKSSMYPYQFYYDQSTEIQKYYQLYFDENFYRIENYPELSKDVLELFDSTDFSVKTQAINILSIFKLYF